MKNSSRGSEPREQKPARSQRRGLLRGLLVLVLLGLIAGAAGIGAHAWKRDIRLTGVHVEGNRLVSTEEILARAAVPSGIRVFSLDPSAVCRRVLAHPYIVSADVRRDVHAGLTIRVTEREPIAAIPGSRLLYVDATGLVLPELPADRQPDVPLLTGAVPGKPLVPGKRFTTPAVLAGLELLTVAGAAGEDLDRLISEVSIQPDGQLQILTADFAVPVMVGSGSVPDKLAALEVFWNSLVTGRGARDLAYVDLRFDRQVVVRWK